MCSNKDPHFGVKLGKTNLKPMLLVKVCLVHLQKGHGSPCSLGSSQVQNHLKAVKTHQQLIGASQLLTEGSTQHL